LAKIPVSLVEKSFHGNLEWPFEINDSQNVGQKGFKGILIFWLKRDSFKN